MENKIINNYNFKYYYNIKYYNILYHLYIKKFIGNFLKRGNKERSFRFLLELKYKLKKKIKNDPNIVLFMALIKSMFKFYFIKLRLGSTKKDLPMATSKYRQVRVVIKNLIKLANSKKNRSLNIIKLCNLIILSSKKKGPLIIKNNKNYRKALNNRSLLFFRRKK